MAHISFLGRLADVAGYAQGIYVGDNTLLNIIASLADTNPELSAALSEPSIRAAINLDLVPVGENPIVAHGDELAFMPPVSGG